jgi:Cys-rich four helix bundle protein (predicted Tat secretion target)
VFLFPNVAIIVRFEKSNFPDGLSHGLVRIAWASSAGSQPTAIKGTIMQRREVLKTVAGAMAVAMATSAMAATQEHEHHHDHDHDHDHGTVDGKLYAGLIDSSSDCLKTGEACVAHCLVLLGEGDKEMAACAQSVSELLASCSALMKLASQGSKFTPAMARVVADVCADCETECRKHENKHDQCKACADSCAACLKECKALAA